MSVIRQWLEELGLGRYADAFDENDIRLAILPDLTPDDLKDIGVQSVGHRRALLSAIAALRDGVAGEPVAVDPPRPDREFRAPEAERRQITVLFCDLVGSTALSAKLDPEELRDIMAVYQNAAGAVIERYDGHVAQYLGDALMTYFGWPRAHEDDAQRAIRAGLGIVDAVKQIAAPSELSVRVGIATGPVVVGETGSGDASVPKTAVGKTPNLAARVQGLAAPDTVLIADSTRQLIGGAFALDDLGHHRLKGIGGDTGVFQVTGESTALSRFDAAQGAGMTAFVGRESETALLAERWSQAAEGEGHVVLLGGEAGIGKSRIIQELRDRVADEPHIRVRYQCLPYHANSAYYPLIEQVERAAGIARDDDTDAKLDKLEAILTQSTDNVAAVAPLIAAMMSLPTERYPPLELSPQRQKDSLIAMLAEQVAGLARDQPVLMIFEDAHWSDPTTLEALGAIINRVQDLAVLLVITYRPEFIPPWASHGHVTIHALNRLGRRQGAAMVAKVTGGKPLPDAVLDQIVAKTDGVPLFVEELTKTVLEAGFLKDRGDRYELDGPLPDLAIPATLQDSLMARLDRLSSVKEVAQIGACIGREFSYELLAAVSPLGDNDLRDALQQLVVGGLIFAHGNPPRASYSFKHALVQDAAYQSLLKSRCQQVHKSIAQSLENQFPDLKDTAPELIAHHYTEGGLADAEPAVGYWRSAGDRAADHFAHIEAIGHLRNALSALNTLEASGDTVEQELELRLGLVASMRLVDRYEDALEELDHAEALATAHKRNAALTRIHYSRGNIYFPMGNVEGCLTEHEAARQFAIEAGSPEDEARALGGLGDAYYMRGRMLTAHDHFDRCIKLCQAHGFGGIEAVYLYMRATSHVYQIQFAEALADCQAAIESAAAAGEARAEIVAHLVAGEILYEQRKFDRAEEHARKGLEVARRLGARRFEPFLSEIIARIRIFAGDRAEAREILEECLAISRDTGLSFIGPWILGAIAWASDDPEHRRQALAEGQTILDQGCVGHNYYWFYRDAMEAMLGVGQWDEVETYAAALASKPRFLCSTPRWHPLTLDRLYLGAYGGRALNRIDRIARMKIGVIIFPTEYTISMTELAPALEERGFDTLLVPEHTHIPTSRRTPWPGGKPLPKEYKHSLDPFVALSFAAAASKTLTIGTGICLIPQREPLATAKAVASLDLLSGGRVMFGMGAGWNVDEMENHGTAPETRFKLLEERVRAMKALWTEEEAAFHGDFVNFDPVWSYPKPVQKPHPPLYLGGESIHTMRRVVDFCDGWLPRARGGFDMAAGIAQLREVADAAGRDWSTIGVSVFGAKPDAEIFAGYAEAGVDGALIVVPSEPRDDVLRRLDGYADLIE